MASFRSNDELFRFVQELIAKLDTGGHGEAAADLRDGLRCLNGLTDGWALFLDAIRRAQAHAVAPDERRSLEAIRKAVHEMVRRR